LARTRRVYLALLAVFAASCASAPPQTPANVQVEH
jgi:hypothetical protein